MKFQILRTISNLKGFLNLKGFFPKYRIVRITKIGVSGAITEISLNGRTYWGLDIE